MAIVSTDIKFYLSGGAGNAAPDSALGGAISTTEITTATLANLFDTVSGAESAAGDIEYRCIYAKNTHGTLTLSVAKVWISTQTSASDTSMDIALGGEGDNGVAETIANENTAPVGESFTNPTTYAGGLSLGNLVAGHFFPIWVRWTVNAAAAANASDAGILSVQGDTPA